MVTIQSLNSHVRPKQSSFQNLQSYTLVLIIFSTRYWGFVPLIDLASFAVRFAMRLVSLGSRLARKKLLVNFDPNM